MSKEFAEGLIKLAKEVDDKNEKVFQEIEEVNKYLKIKLDKINNLASLNYLHDTKINAVEILRIIEEDLLVNKEVEKD